MKETNFRHGVGRAKLLLMQKKFIKHIHSFIAIPLLAFSFGTGGIDVESLNLMNVPSVQINNGIAGDTANQSDSVEYRAALIDSYFATRKLPLAGYGKVMVLAADKNDIDWRLIPAIAMRESTGGQNACQKVPNNPFGWGSCKIGFKTTTEAIESLARHLGGNHPKTNHYYANKETKQILETYNPPSIVPEYAKQVMKIMDTISKEEETTVS